MTVQSSLTSSQSVPVYSAGQVQTLARVKTGAAVLAGFVIGAVVKISIAKQTSPTFIAVTLPRLLAISVKTSWIADALVTQLSVPSEFATKQEIEKRGNL